MQHHMTFELKHGYYAIVKWDGKIVQLPLETEVFTEAYANLRNLLKGIEDQAFVLAIRHYDDERLMAEEE